MRVFIKTDGTVTNFSDSLSLAKIHRLIQAETLDVVNLHDGHVMFVDDAGVFLELPVNAKATLMVYPFAPETGPAIYGDVVIVPDADYENPEEDTEN